MGSTQWATMTRGGPEDDLLNLLRRIGERFENCFTIVDMELPDRPLVFVNRQFQDTTGYSEAECLNRNCRFLQGPGTDPAGTEFIRRALGEGRASCTDLLNYRKDGSAFFNRLMLVPFSAAGHSYFIGLQTDLGTVGLKPEDGVHLQTVGSFEIRHLVNNPLAAALASLGELEREDTLSAEALQELQLRIQNGLSRMSHVLVHIQSLSEFEGRDPSSS